MSRLFGKPVHNGFVVVDIEQTVNRMLKAGIGPVYYMKGIRIAARYRGERHDPLMSLAFLFSGDVMYEFAQQHDNTPSVYKEFLAHNPEGGLHHIAYFSDDFDAAIQNAAAAGHQFEVVEENIDGDGKAFEAYLQPVNVTDSVLVQLVTPGLMDDFFAAMVQGAATWQGEEPVRNALDLFPPEMSPPVEPV